MQAPNRSSINQNDFMAGDVAVVIGQYCKLGEIIIPAGIHRGIGLGSSNSQSDAIGRMYAKIMDNTAAPGVEVTGKFRISVFSPQDRSLRVLGEWPAAALDQNATDRTKQIPLPFTNLFIGKDVKFVFELKPDRACTVGKTNTVVQIDSTDQLDM